MGNSWKFSHLVEAFSTQWGDAALAARDAKARKSEAVVAAVDNFDLSGLSAAASRIEKCNFHRMTRIHKLLSVRMKTITTTKKTLTITLVALKMSWMKTANTAGTPTDDPELLEQFDGNLEDADASASQVYASASRSFQEARDLLAPVKSARDYFLVVGIGAF